MSQDRFLQQNRPLRRRGVQPRAEAAHIRSVLERSQERVRMVQPR
jgi:hypothetical protein